MHFIVDYHLAILIATALCFVASAVIWMAGPHHRTEFAAPPNQEGVMAALGMVDAGSYYFPFGDRNDKEAFQKAMKMAEAGPSGVLYIRPRGRFNMGKTMFQQVLFFLALNIFVAYLTHHAVPAGASYLNVFQVAGTAAFMGTWFASVPESIWFARPWKNLWLQLVDSLIYTGLIAGTFGWLMA